METEQDPFFGGNHTEGIGGLITRYNLFGGPRGTSQDDDSYREQRNHQGFHEILHSSLFQKSLLGLIALVVVIHLAFDSVDKGGWQAEEFVANPAKPLEFQYGNPIEDSSTHVSVHPAPEESAFHSSPTHGKANEESEDALPIVKVPPPPAHSFSFGGFNNKGHNNKETEKSTPKLEDEIEFDAREKIGPWDISHNIILNEQGHYIHDPIKSPFASHLYQVNGDNELLRKRQKEYETRMATIKDEYGEWHNPPKRHVAGQVEFGDYVFRDVFLEDFELDDTCWQMDADYIRVFIDEAQALVEATREGIVAEYGHWNPSEEDKFPFGVIKDPFEVLNGTAVHHESLEKLPGVAYLPQNSWDGLVRKLLHAMITEDHFYVVVAGRADTYGANNFARTQVMQFNYIMEPIFHKLGVTLISRNMGMDASTAVSALGGADIYGEADILWHIQDADAEEKHGEFDLLHRQMILSGERVPIILSSNTDELTIASKGAAWVGNLQPGADMCDNVSIEDVPACQNLQCAEGGNICNPNNSVCWEPRSDWNPDMQLDEVGSPVEGNPGYRQHQLEGRKMTLLVLRALNAALDQWRQELDKGDTLPLDPALWHVGDAYTEIRKSIMTLRDRDPGEAVGLSASCELLMKELDPRICHIPMHAFTEWTPRVIPERQSLLAVADNLIVETTEEEMYEGPDILPLSWRLTPEVIDVHMIAIAAEKGDEQDDELGDDGNTRMLSTSEAAKRRDLVHAASMNKDSRDDNMDSRRRLHIVDWSGWKLVGTPAGVCDGSAQSRCNRTVDNNCLLANHNHYKGNLVGTPNNGWLMMSLHGVRHGIILARLEFGAMDKRPDDLVFDYAINGEVTEISKPFLGRLETVVVEDLPVYPLLLQKDMDLTRSAEDMKYNVAIRIRSDENPDFEVRFSHLYFA